MDQIVVVNTVQPAQDNRLSRLYTTMLAIKHLRLVGRKSAVLVALSLSLILGSSAYIGFAHFNNAQTPKAGSQANPISQTADGSAQVDTKAARTPDNPATQPAVDPTSTPTNAQTSATQATVTATDSSANYSNAGGRVIVNERKSSGQQAACVPNKSYAVPVSIDLSNRPAGLTTIIDQPQYYQISAGSLGTLRSTIDRCSAQQSGLDGKYHAATNYQVNWRYQTLGSKDGTCRLVNIRVGVRVNQLLPEFVPTRGADPSVSQKWRSYATNLATHENGHTALSTAYASRLTEALRSMPSTPCTSIHQQAAAVAQSHMSLLADEHTAYDGRTNHGATQGAAL